MFGRNLVASLLGAVLLAFALPAVSPQGNIASAGQSAREGGKGYVLERKGRRGHRRAPTQRIYLPMGPAYIYYDYPYYYSRGHYPTHIGGYVYYIPKSAGRCSIRYWRCVNRHRGAGKNGACRCR